MSRYACYKCETEHGTDNVVAYCALCYAEAKVPDFDKIAERFLIEFYGDVGLTKDLRAETMAALRRAWEKA